MGKVAAGNDTQQPPPPLNHSECGEHDVISHRVANNNKPCSSSSPDATIGNYGQQHYELNNSSSSVSIVKSLVFALNSTDAEIILLGLDGIKSILKHGDRMAMSNYRNNGKFDKFIRISFVLIV